METSNFSAYGGQTSNFKKRLMVGIYFGFWILMLGVSLGCARTVTQIVTYGDQMAVEVTLRGTMEVNSNRYFLVLSSNSNFKIPLPPPDNIDFEFIEPDSQPLQGSIADYFTNFYSTWAGYAVIDPGGLFLVKGPFVQNQPITREVASSLGEPAVKITFNFRLSRIFESPIPATIYFDFVTVPWPYGQKKLAADRLTVTNAYISKVAGSIITVDDEENIALDPAADILKCRVTIQ